MGYEFAVLGRLTDVLHDRNQRRPPESYTTSLLSGGAGHVSAKILEEAAEVREAAAEAGDAGREHLVREAADLLYHLMVMLELRGASLADVAAELGRREGISGLEEKRSRQ